MEADGRIVITPKNKAEAYALKRWNDEFGANPALGIIVGWGLETYEKKKESTE